jgi:Dolichyl-phosphate-mannose-protein mannosyltransferase
MVLPDYTSPLGSASSLDSTGPPSAGIHATRMRSSWTRRAVFARLLFALVFLFSALYMAKELKRGWHPMDEGMWGQSAEHVLDGQLPHRDYHESYTGGLTYLNALAFRAFGINSASTRYMLYLFFLAWVPAVYYVARLFVSSPIASALTFLAVAWGVPNYAGANPSWYNLFFATFGLAALLRYVETQRSRWLVVAGFCGGVSFLFKQSGLYFVAAALLFFLFREQVANTADSAQKHDSRLYRILFCVVVLAYEAFLFDLVVKRLNSVTLCYFFLPASLVGVLLVWREFASTHDQSHRFAFLLREVAFFATGVAVPVAIFLLPFVKGGAIPDLVRGVFILPAKQIANAGWTPSIFRLLGGVAANVAIVLGVFLIWPKFRKLTVGLALLGMSCGLLLTRSLPSVHKEIWGAFWVLLPTVVIAGMTLLVRPSGSNQGSLSKVSKENFQKLFLILSVTALCSLVQFPFTTAAYYCYVAPLAGVAAAAVVSFLKYRPRLFLVGAYCFALIYVVFDITPGFVFGMGDRYRPDIMVAKLDLPRAGGLRVGLSGKQVYEDLGRILEQHARNQYIFCTPDCPEMYFLYTFRNPTRYFFDFFDEPNGRTQRILATIHEHNINLVVLNEDPVFSLPVATDLRAALELEFPNHVAIGEFDVRWKR